MEKHRILITGATGYVGGKLLRRLEHDGHEVNCLVRNPFKLKNPGPNTRIFQGDILVRSSLWAAFEGVDTAYFLIHFLHEKTDFEAKEIKSAENFAAMARSAGVKRIIYLGGLGDETKGLSPHLRSRQEVGHILRASSIPTIELRASIVIGEGSLSFGLIKDLTEHLPFMVTPRWVTTKAQPIGIRDLLDYLVQSLDLVIEHDEIVEIGGSDQMSYGGLMQEYARQRGLKRSMLPVPVLTPRLSSRWVACFSHVDRRLAGKLIEGIKYPTVVNSRRAAELFPIRPASAAEAMHEALARQPVQHKKSAAAPHRQAL